MPHKRTIPPPNVRQAPEPLPPRRAPSSDSCSPLRLGQTTSRQSAGTNHNAIGNRAAAPAQA
eukprot:6839866-Prymnesium_polylepis.1